MRSLSARRNLTLPSAISWLRSAKFTPRSPRRVRAFGAALRKARSYLTDRGVGVAALVAAVRETDGEQDYVVEDGNFVCVRAGVPKS